MTPQQILDPDPTPDSVRLTPRDAVLDLLAESGGQLPERTLFTELSYPTDACRRVLGELSAAGEIERSEAGSRRVVCLSDASPTTGL